MSKNEKLCEIRCKIDLLKTKIDLLGCRLDTQAHLLCRIETAIRELIELHHKIVGIGVEIHPPTPRVDVPAAPK